MLVIRLFRVGKRNQPAYKIVVTDKQNAAAKGRFVEEVGFYNPLTKLRNLKGDRVKYWMSVGAKPSATVHNMLVSDKVIDEAKIPKHKKSKKPAESQSESAIQTGGEAPEAPAADVSAVASAPVPVGDSTESGDPSESAEEKKEASMEEAPVPEEAGEEKLKEAEVETPVQEEKKETPVEKVQETPTEEKENKPKEESKAKEEQK